MKANPKESILLQKKYYDTKLILVHIFISKCVTAEQKERKKKR